MTDVDAEDTSSAIVLLELDPRILADHPANLRKAAGDLTGLTASIRERGVLQPIVVSALDDGWQVHFGHRRTAAAIKAGLPKVPVVVIPGDGTAGDVTDMLAENVHRKDLTATEEASAYLQLQGEGLTVDAIAKTAGVDKARVEMGLEVAGSEVATALGQKHDLTLDQSLVLAEFDDDPEALEELAGTIVEDPYQFDHVASLLRQEVAAREATAMLEEKLGAGGVPVLPADKRPAHGSTLMRGTSVSIEYLKGPKGKAMTVAQHRRCEGHAGFVQAGLWGRPAVLVYCCKDPLRFGHEPMFAHQLGSTAKPKADDMTPVEREKAKAERRAVIDNNKAWAAATPVRLAFVTTLLRRRSAPKGALRFGVELVGESPHWIAGGTDQILNKLTGKSGGTGYSQTGAAGALAKAGTDAQLPLALIALVAAAVEGNFVAWNRPYEQADDRARRYLLFLQGAGYTLSPVEELITKTKGGKK